MRADREHRQRIAAELQQPVELARELARRFGLSPLPVNYWIVDHDEMNALIAYEGFQERYPHWRWGMAYDRQRKRDRYLGGKAFEIVNYDDPAHAFLQESNELADQKAVITHVEAHADFFANNEWFDRFESPRGTDWSAAGMLARHARTIEEYMTDPEIDRSEVERWIDHVLTLQDNIDQHRAYTRQPGGADRSAGSVEDDSPVDLEGLEIEGLDLEDHVREEVFSEEFLESLESGDEEDTFPATPEKDLLGFLRAHGKQYDADADRAREMTDWQREILELLRAEAHYFAAQRMTKVMNEGWAAYWESRMMADEGFADPDEFVTYADHLARVLASPGLNPYRLGKALWEYVENATNRREVLERLLRVEGITARTLEDRVDFEAVLEELEAPAALLDIDPDAPEHLADLPAAWIDEAALDRALTGDLDLGEHPWRVLSEAGMARRHYSLVKPQHRGFLERVGMGELEEIERYLFERDRYDSIEAALADVEFSAGWERMREIRASHNDVTFLDAFLTPEFIRSNDFFTYEYAQSTGQYHVASTDPDDVKRKLLLQFTNFGKPTIAVYDGNHDNAGELLLGHEYNGIPLDLEQARATLERVFELWGRPVTLLTIVRTVDEDELRIAGRRGEEPEAEAEGRRLRYDGEEHTTEEVPWETVEHLAPDDGGYRTVPEDWSLRRR